MAHQALESYGQGEQGQPFAVLHVPHSSTYIPADLRETLLLSDKELSAELLRMTDHYTHELFQCDPYFAAHVIFPVSRLIIDPERFLDDSMEAMSEVGMGVIYTRTSDGRVLREPPTQKERASLLERFYRPHHAKLSQAVRAALTHRGSCLIIDCHSFPATALPYEMDKSLGRPEICIGTDKFHTPDWLVEYAAELFQTSGFSVMLDRPFSGALVPNDFYLRDDRVLSIMIEIRRDLYMNEQAGRKGKDFAAIRNTLGDAVKRIVEMASVGI